MKRNININTEGVLVLASSKRLMEEYRNKDFNYEFPNGLAKLLNENAIVALTTNEGDTIKLNLQSDKPLNWRNYDKVIEQTLSFQPEDELLVMNHAEFTMICSKNGNYKDCGWPIKLIEPMVKGNYSLEIGIVYRGEEFEKYQVYFELDINFSLAEGDKVPNEVSDIGE